MTEPKRLPEGICDMCEEGMGFYMKGQKYCRVCAMKVYASKVKQDAQV